MSKTAANLWDAPQFGKPPEKPIDRQEINAQLEQIKEEARQEGYEKGLSQADDEFSKTIASLSVLEHELRLYLDIFDEALFREIIGFGEAIAEKILRKQISDFPEHMVLQLKEALAAIETSDERIRARLNPQDYDFLRNHDSSQALIASMDLESDESLERGDCVLSNSHSHVASLIKEKISQVFSKLS